LINRLSESGKKAALGSLTEAQAQQLRYDWGFWGGPNQQMPPGDWFTWLFMTVRDWGKTRTATETISRLVGGPTPLVAPAGRAASSPTPRSTCAP
jgi:phage terminase large subunit-like protein